MKQLTTLALAAFLIASLTCLEAVADGPQSGRDLSGATPPHTRKVKPTQRDEFIDAISARNYKLAFSMLHPKLAAAWTLPRFTREWEQIRLSLSDSWNPKGTGWFRGRSPLGQHERTEYTLVSDPNSIYSANLLSMKPEGEWKIMGVIVKGPHKEPPSTGVISRTEEFAAAMSREDYSTVQTMFDPLCPRYVYSLPNLRKARSALGASPRSPPGEYYRVYVNSRISMGRFIAVRLTGRSDPSTYVDITINPAIGSAPIVMMSYKASQKR